MTMTEANIKTEIPSSAQKRQGPSHSPVIVIPRSETTRDLS
jgi:hypothetical protein